MAYQLSTLVSSIKQRAKDPSFSDVLVTEYIQETQDAVLGRLRLPNLEVTVQDTLNAAASAYPLAEDIQVIQSLTMKALTTASGTLRPEYLPSAQIFDYQRTAPSSSGPLYFTLFGRQIMFGAPLDGSYQFTLAYVRRPIRLINDTDVPDIPEEYKQILIRGGLAGVEEYRENFDIAAVHQRKVEDLMEDMALRYNLRQTVTPHKARFGTIRRGVNG